MVATSMGEEIDSSLQLAKGVTLRAKPGLILMKHAFRYIRSSGNMALMLPILSNQGFKNEASTNLDIYDTFINKRVVDFGYALENLKKLVDADR